MGGGLAAQRCAESLRLRGYDQPVRIACGEAYLPYDRPPLSKELLAADAREEIASFRPESWYAEKSIEVLLSRWAEALDAPTHRVSFDGGESVDYDTLVIATGARPRTLPIFDGYANVSTLRTLDDAHRLRGLLAGHARLVVIGAGFIGLEVAAAARAAGAEVVVIELASLPLAGLLGPEIGGWLAELHTAAGVELILGEVVTAVSGAETVESLTLSDDRTISCDHVLVGVGVVPDVGWLESAGVPASGVATDELGRSELPDVLAAGDAAAFFDPFLDRHVVSGHWEAAARQGTIVAGTIVGAEPPPLPLSSFWSDQYGSRIQYLGHAELADSTVIEGSLADRDFAAEYSRDGELVAALVVGRPRAVGELRTRLSYMTERMSA